MQQHPQVTSYEEDCDPEPEPNYTAPVWSFSEENEEFIRPENTNKFEYDPENGGGRRHRIHNVSRIKHLRGGEAGLRDCVQNLFGSSSDFNFRSQSMSDDEVMPF